MPYYSFYRITFSTFAEIFICTNVYTDVFTAFVPVYSKNKNYHNILLHPFHS